jgi:small subunit ribosomal protein S9
LLDQQSYYATGHRKNAIARVWLTPGNGNILINGKPLSDYIQRDALQQNVREPLLLANVVRQFDVRATARGGGLAGQAGAIRHGIARALIVWNPELRTLLRRTQLLTRDPRVKERKKYGHKRARRGFQFSKR